jgi:isopenicillin N synthase-like dioxygenase
MAGISFPSTAQVAELRTIKLNYLLDYHEEEVMKLVLACQEVGFFYLDLTSSGSRKMLENLETSNAIMTDWFSQDLETKMKTETVSRSHGYNS